MSTTRGSRKLREWLADRDRNQQWLAEQLSAERGERVYQSSVSAWLRGAQMPLWGGLAVQKLTGIPAADWTVSEEESRSAIKAARSSAKAG